MIFVFDIDDTICSIDENTTSDENQKEIEQYLGPDFLERHTLSVLDYNHYIFPGFYALFRWLDDHGCSFHFLVVPGR